MGIHRPNPLRQGTIVSLNESKAPQEGGLFISPLSLPGWIAHRGRLEA